MTYKAFQGRPATPRLIIREDKNADRYYAVLALPQPVSGDPSRMVPVGNQFDVTDEVNALLERKLRLPQEYKDWVSRRKKSEVDAVLRGRKRRKEKLKAEREQAGNDVQAQTQDTTR